MILKKLKLNNIRSYNEAEIEFPLGSTLLSGDIGSGKTTILLGVEFALFGLQPGQRGSSLLRNGEDKGGIILEFEIDNKNIIIERTLKRGKTISQDYCSIAIDNEKKEISVTELKNKVLELLKYPSEFSKKQNLLYKFTVYTPQEEMKQIILQDSATRTNTLRHVFGIDKYKKILENTSIVISKIREEKRKKEGMTEGLEQEKLSLIQKEGEVESKYKNLSSIEKELFTKTELRKKIQEERQEITKKIEEKKDLERELEKTKLLILNKKDTLFNNNKSIDGLKKQISELQKLAFEESKISEIENSIIELKKQKDKFNEQNIEINSKINSLLLKNEDSKNLERKISNLEQCPTCLQEVDATYRANVLNKIHNDLSKNKRDVEELEEQKKILLQNIGKLNISLSEREKEFSDLRILKIKLQSIEEKNQRLIEIEKSNNMLNNDIELLQKHQDSLNKSIVDLSPFQGIFEEKTKQLDEALKQEKLVEIKIAELRKEIDVFSRQIEEIKEKIKKTEETKKKLDYLIKLENWLSKDFIPVISYIEKNVMAKLKREFSEFFTEWFSILVSDTFNVRLEDDFTPVIEQQDYEIDYAYLSGGERTAVALSYRLALNQVINSFLSKIKTKDLVILDEPTDGFSEQQLDKMRDILQQLKVEQLILVSHEQKIEGFVENVIKFRKELGITKIIN